MAAAAAAAPPPTEAEVPDKAVAPDADQFKVPLATANQAYINAYVRNHVIVHLNEEDMLVEVGKKLATAKNTRDRVLHNINKMVLTHLHTTLGFQLRERYSLLFVDVQRAATTPKGETLKHQIAFTKRYDEARTEAVGPDLTLLAYAMLMYCATIYPAITDEACRVLSEAAVAESELAAEINTCSERCRNYADNIAALNTESTTTPFAPLQRLDLTHRYMRTTLKILLPA